MERRFRTRREVNLRLVFLVAAVVFLEFQLNALNNLLQGPRMTFAWSLAGFTVAAIVAAIERLKLRRGQ